MLVSLSEFSLSDTHDPLALTACIDMGKSLNKIVYAVEPEGKQKIMLIEPEVATLSQANVGELKKGSSNCNPEDDAWIELQDGTGMAFGMLAQQPCYRLQSSSKKKEHKFELAQWRVVAVVCAISQKEGLGRGCASHKENWLFTRVVVAATVLLPILEYSSHGLEIVHALSGKLKAFRVSFRSLNYEIVFSSLDVKPEGAGQLMIRQADPLAEPFKERNILCLIFGHYNITGIFYCRGKVQRHGCPSLGFFQIVESVAANTSLDKTNIPEARLAEAVYLRDSKPEYMRAFLRGTLSNSNNLDKELERIFHVIKQSESDYWKAVEQWLQYFMAEDLAIVNEVLITGGALKKVEEKLKEFFAGVPLVRGGGNKVVKAIKDTFKLKPSDPLIDRIVEPFGIHTALLETVRQQNTQKVS